MTIYPKHLDYTEIWKQKNYSEPTFVFQLREKSLQTLNTLPFPNKDQESWRKVSLSNFQPLTYLSQDFSKLEILPEINLKSYLDLSETEKQKYEEILLHAQNKLKENYFAQLAFAFHSKLYFLCLDESYSYKNLLLEVRCKDLTNLPIFVVYVKRFSKINLVLRYLLEETQEISFFNSLEIVVQEDSSQLELVSIEDFGNSVFHFRNFLLTQAQDTHSLVSHFNLGGYRGKTFFHCDLNGKGSKTEILGASSVSGREQQDIELTVFHSQGYTESNLLFHTVATDKAHHIFTGILQIPKTSLHVQANQINKNLMLKKTARTESMPKLEVFADDVKCSHGATIGEVDEEQMFYLLTRGIPEKEARNLIVDGFLSEILDRISPEDLREEIRKKLLNKLHV